MKLTYCPFCLSAVHGEICPHCGSSISYTGDPMHLQVGYVLNGAHPYVLGASLGQGGFGITYIALDIMTNRRVAIKEYFPTYCAGRNGNVSVISYLGQEDTFHKGKERFLEEARMLKSLSDLPSVVDVLDFFEANNSAYLVMEFLEGSSLKDHVEQKGKLPAQSFLAQMKPLMADMEIMHRRGVVHRDIAPDNIIMLPGGQLKLIDFGAARSYVGDKSMTVVVKKGFAPVEQYMRKGSNASTDIYALAATIYYCITGIVPPDSAERQYGDAALCAPTELGAELSEAQEFVLEKALAIQPNERTQSIAEMIKALEEAPKVPVPVSQTDKRPKKKKKENSRIGLSENKRTEQKAKTSSADGQYQSAGSEMPEQSALTEAGESVITPKAPNQKKRLIPAIAAAAFLAAALFLLPTLFAAEDSSETEPVEPTMPVILAEPSATQAAQTEPADEAPERVVLEYSREDYPIGIQKKKDVITIGGENIYITVENGRDVTVTVYGLKMKDEYPVNWTVGANKTLEYRWEVRLRAGAMEHNVYTIRPRDGGTRRYMRPFQELETLVSGGTGKTQKAYVSHTDDSITWRYSLPATIPFDFTKLTNVQVYVTDPTLKLDLLRDYKTDSRMKPIENTHPTAKTAQSETVPEEPSAQTEPVMMPQGDEKLSFTTEDKGDTFNISGKNLQISVKDGKHVTATLSGLKLKDEYTVNLPTTKKNYWEYYWYIDMSDGINKERIATFIYAEEPGKKNTAALNDFNHVLMREEHDSDGVYFAHINDANMTFTPNSITWEYTMDSEVLFDFRKVTEFNVIVKDPSLDLYINQTYVKDTSKQTQTSANPAPETTPVVQTAVPGQQQLFEDELTFTSNKIEAVRMRSNGYSLHSAKFLDKPVNNCVSLSAQITVEEGSPEEFILYLQDLTKWYEAGRIKATGESVVNGTLSFSKPISFNAFAIVPSEGDYATSITYKLTGASIRGSQLQSVHTGNNIVFTGDGLKIQVNDNREVIVTVSGLNMLDEYPSMISRPKGSREYQWNVRLTSGLHSLSFQTDCPVPVAKFNQPKITQWKDMKHTLLLELLEFGELDNHIIKRDKATVTHTSNSITWTYLLDKNQPFDFTSGITAEVFWYDDANHSSDYQYFFGR